MYYNLQPRGYSQAWNQYYASNYVAPNYPNYVQPRATGLSSDWQMPGAQAVGDRIGSGLANFLSLTNPIAGNLLGFGMNLLGSALQFNQQEKTQRALYEDYMSPQSRMRDMQAAGINPAAAAQGIAGSSPSMPAAPSMPSSPVPDLGNNLAQSENVRLQQEVQAANIENTQANTDYIRSKDQGQMIDNAYAEARQMATLRNMKLQGDISQVNFQMLEQDSYYHGAEAYQHFQQTMFATQQMSAQLQIMEQDFYNKMAEYNVFLTQAGLNSAQINKVYSDIGLNSAMINQINANVRNLDADTLLKGAQYDEQKIKVDMMEAKNYFVQDALQVFKNTGFNIYSPVNQNFLYLSAQGKTKEAEAFMGNVYDFSRGQYGAKGAQARQWINTAVGAIATVGGVVMMATGVGVAPGAALTAYGATKLTSQYSSKGNSMPTTNPTDSYDFSHLGGFDY